MQRHHPARAMSKQIVSSMTIVLALMLSISTSYAQEREEYKIIGHQHATFLDGRYEMSYLMQNPLTGNIKVMPYKQAIKTLPSQSNRQPLHITQLARWKPGTVITFGMTPDAVAFKTTIESVVEKYLNSRRGSSTVPIIRIISRIDSDEGDSWEYFSKDGKNTVIMAEDNRFSSSRGMAYGVRYLFDETLEIYEADVCFRSDIFDFQPEWFPKYLICHEFGHILGYLHTQWTLDIMDPLIHIGHDDTPFENENSTVWRLWKKRNRLHYDDLYTTTPRILPTTKSILDLSVPAGELEISDLAAIALTNLKGIPGKPLIMKIFKGWLSPSLVFQTDENFLGSGLSAPSYRSGLRSQQWVADEEPLLTLEGFSSYITSSGTVPIYRGSRIQLGQKEDWEILIEILKAEGKETNIDDINYNQALKVTILVEGYMDTENEIKSFAITHVYLIKFWDDCY